jgi:hypothetical protein
VRLDQVHDILCVDAMTKATGCSSGEVWDDYFDFMDEREAQREAIS